VLQVVEVPVGVPTLPDGYQSTLQAPHALILKLCRVQHRAVAPVVLRAAAIPALRALDGALFIVVVPPTKDAA
jgi:hypothetical protein